MWELAILTVLILIAALLYSSVGHAGASGYLAAMALVGVDPDVMRPAALLLNIIVASIGTVQFCRAGCFSWRVFWPFAAASIPFAFVGGTITLPGSLYRLLLGGVLLCAAARLCVRSKVSNEPRSLSLPLALACGAVLGLLAGLTGTGGGIFLSPLLLFMGWAETRQSGGISAAFILVNSIAGIMGVATKVPTLPSEILLWAVTAGIGGIVGATLGSQWLGTMTLRRLLAVILVIAALKLILT